MSHQKNNSHPSCQICGTSRASELRRAAVVRPTIVQLILKKRSSWDENGWICVNDLHNFQYEYVHSLLETEKGELSELELEVLKGLKEHEILSRNPDISFEAKLTLGERLSDKIADFGGSWVFIITFGIVLIGWMLLNSLVLRDRSFDPFPYILLNLVLSTLAAIQAPIIMMSQNRQEARDRARALHDYQVNLKAELEIRQLHQKLDHLLSHQWERLIEIQKIQIELIDELRARR